MKFFDKLFKRKEYFDPNLFYFALNHKNGEILFLMENTSLNETSNVSKYEDLINGRIYSLDNDIDAENEIINLQKITKFIDLDKNMTKQILLETFKQTCEKYIKDCMTISYIYIIRKNLNNQIKKLEDDNNPIYIELLKYLKNINKIINEYYDAEKPKLNVDEIDNIYFKPDLNGIMTPDPPERGLMESKHSNADYNYSDDVIFYHEFVVKFKNGSEQVLLQLMESKQECSLNWNFNMFALSLKDKLKLMCYGLNFIENYNYINIDETSYRIDREIINVNMDLYKYIKEDFPDIRFNYFYNKLREILNEDSFAKEWLLINKLRTEINNAIASNEKTYIDNSSDKIINFESIKH